MFLPVKSGVVKNSTGIAVQDKQAAVNHRQVLRTKEKSPSFIEGRRKLGGVVLNKSSLVENGR